MECIYIYPQPCMKTKKGKAHSYKYVVSSSGYWQITVYFLWVYINSECASKTFFTECMVASITKIEFAGCFMQYVVSTQNCTACKSM